MKVGLFVPCYVDAVYLEVGIAAWKLLRHLDVDVTYPRGQTCCGPFYPLLKTSKMP